MNSRDAAKLHRTDAREAEGSGLLSRPASDGRAGSNPAPSAALPGSERAPCGERGVAGVSGESGGARGQEAANAAKCPECKAPIGEIHTFGCSRYPEVMRENIERGPLLDPLAMPPEELARLKSEGYGHLIAKPRRMDDVPGYRRDW